MDKEQTNQSASEPASHPQQSFMWKERESERTTTTVEKWESVQKFMLCFENSTMWEWMEKEKQNVLSIPIFKK